MRNNLEKARLKLSSMVRRDWRIPRLAQSLALLGLVSANSSGCDAHKSVVPVEVTTKQEVKFAMQRKALVDGIRKKGVTSERVLKAVLEIPRHLFVPEGLRDSSYEDGPLPIGKGQTISQPYIVAYMTEALQLERSDQVLEIGTGSGYQAAVLSKLVDQVYSVEVIPELAERAKTTFASVGISNVDVRTGDGYEGWKEHAPFDAIILTAAPKEIPQALIDQLAEGGRLVAPVGGDSVQWLIQVDKSAGRTTRKTLLPVRFVPMVPENLSN